MTNDIKISREQLEKCLRDATTIRFEDDKHVLELRALLAAPVVERQDGSALMRIAADLANRRPLSRLQRICEGTGKISIEHLSEDVDKCGDLLAGIALDIRRAIASPPAPVAVSHPFADKVIRKLQRFHECMDDGQGADIGRHWFDLLTQLGLLNRVQRSPALWEITQQGEDCLDKVKELNQ